MGWTGTHKPKGQKMKDFFASEFSSVEILACKTLQRRETYMAVRRKNDPNEHVFAIVCLLHFTPQSYYNVTYKDMSEFCGPNASNCPEDVLSLLSPLEDQCKDAESSSYQWADEWRKRCQENLQKRAAIKIRKGMHIKFEKPLQFTDGSEHTEFMVESGRPMRLRVMNDSFPRVYRIRRDTLLCTPYEVVS